MDMMKIMKNKLILLIVTMIILLIIIKKMNDNITQANTIKTIQKMEDDYNNSTEQPIIPFNIFQTWYTKDLDPDMEKCVNQLKADNPEFKHHLFDDEDCRQFIKQYFDKEVVDAFDSLIPGAYKADLWRLCVLYIYGGIYMDIKLQCINGFKLKYLTFSEHLVYDPLNNIKQNSKYICSSFIVCQSKNIFLLECINQIVYNVKHKYYGISPLHITGPALLGYIYNKYNYKIPINLENKYSYNIATLFNGNIFYKNISVIDSYSSYRKNQIINYFNGTNNTDYRVLWGSNKIYS